MPQRGMERTEPTTEFTRAAIAVVGLCFVLNTLARGNGETFAVFYGPLLDDLGWGRAATASLYSVFMIALGFSGPVVGALFDRYGPRLIYVGGLVAYGAGFLIASHMGSLWQGWLGLGLLCGFGAAATGMTPATGIISRWFTRNMAFAISFAYSGLAFGSILLAPLSGWMISVGGWRWTYQVLGLALLGLGAVVAFLPWGSIGQGVKAPLPPRPLLPDPAVFRRAAFWGLFLIFYLTSTTTYIVQVQSVVYLQEAGYSRVVATLAFGVNSMLSVIGIIGAGWLADRIGHAKTATLGYGLTILGITGLVVLSEGPHPLFLGLYLLCFGGAMGSRGPVVSSLSAQLFEGQVGAVFGLVMIGLGLGGATGAWLAGLLYELTGGYTASLITAAGASILGTVLFWVIPEITGSKT
ncbi:MAG: MFS transporter [Pseudomonadota bacterium]